MLDTAADWAVGHLAAGQDGSDAVLIVDEKASDAPGRPASTAAPLAALPCARSR
jgi:hypothetical protein